MVNLRRRNQNRTTPRPIRAAARPEFAHEDACSRFALGKRALEVEDIGSTSVPALAAKPIIDILPVVAYCEDEAA
jgi:GrpB-like predicted nucleotidyltransferase (UPF0157 family)